MTVLEVLPAVVLAATTTGSGGALLVRRTAVASGVGLLGCTVLLVVSVSGGMSSSAWVALALLAAPLTLMLFPVARWQDPVDFSALTAVAAAGVMGTFVVAARDAMSLVVLLVLAGHGWWSLQQRRHLRRALTWMVVPAVTAFLVFSVVGLTFPADVDVALLVFVPVPVAMYVGATAPHLLDVRSTAVPVISHTAALVAFVAVFVGIAAPLAEAQGLGPDSPLVAVLGLVGAALAAGYHPTQVALRHVVEEVLLGARQDPLTAVGLVSTRIGDDLEDALRVLREVLVLPRVAVTDGGRVLAESGASTGREVTLPLGDDLGSLVVGLRDDEVRLGRTEASVLTLATPLLAQTLRATRLSHELRESRGETIATREEERRRLRRDLHDGLGPQLTGIALTADAATNLAGRDPDASRQLLLDLRAETTRAIESIRGLVYGMRPPALDELGLAGAVTQAAAALRHRDEGGLTVEVAADGLPDLPAAVEVAAYRIVVEALTNVARHSDGRRACVLLRGEGDVLLVQVDDDGTADVPWHPGVGLASMRERADELGGRLTHGPAERGGRVRAELPLG